MSLKATIWAPHFLHLSPRSVVPRPVVRLWPQNGYPHDRDALHDQFKPSRASQDRQSLWVRVRGHAHRHLIGNSTKTRAMNKR
jgi:hypothetical protein